MAGQNLKQTAHKAKMDAEILKRACERACRTPQAAW